MSLTVTHISSNVTGCHQLSLRPRCYLERVNVELPPHQCTDHLHCLKHGWMSNLDGCNSKGGVPQQMLSVVPPP